jgi:hypothetical protein
MTLTTLLPLLALSLAHDGRAKQERRTAEPRRTEIAGVP